MNEKLKRVLIAIFSFIAIGCAIILIWYYSSAEKGAVSSDYAKELATFEKEKEQISEKESVTIPIDFASLQEVNPDVHGWIRIKDSMVDYPIVQNAEEEEFYLNHNWEKNWASEGAIFTQTYNAKDFSDFNTVIYGHQMGDGVETMFHQLGYYLDSDFIDNHREIIIYTPERILTYKVVAAIVYDDRHLMLSFDYTTNEGKQEFIDSVWGSNDMRNQYRGDVPVSVHDRVLSLSTCISGEPHRRLLIEAVLIDEK